MTTATNTNSNKTSTQSILRWVIIAGGLIVVSLILVLILTTERGVIDKTPQRFGGDFTLQGIDGAVSLSDFRGKVVLMYFGFLNCPEVCPASMGIYQQTLSHFNQQELDSIQPLLITIDPARDDIKTLYDFGKYYHESIKGLTGSKADIKQVANQYGAYFEAVTRDSDLDYVFDHTSRYYVIDQNGNLVDAMRHSTTSNELIARIRTLL